MEEGSLGFRDFKKFNKALALKIVWQLISNSDRLWVQILTAKFCPRGRVWGVKTRNGTSSLWRMIQDLKGFFKESTTWQFGKGEGVKVLNQLWHEGWQPQRITTNFQRDATVAQLIDGATR